MTRPATIPESLLLPMLELLENGNNADDIQIWLKEKHNLVVPVRMINRRMKKTRDLQMQAKRDAIAKRASEQAFDYIGIMDERILKLDKIIGKLLTSDSESKLKLAKELSETQLKFIDKQMNLTGMDKHDDSDIIDDTVIDALFEKIGHD